MMKRKIIVLLLLFSTPQVVYGACGSETPGDCYSETTCLYGETGTCYQTIDATRDALYYTLQDATLADGSGYVSPTEFNGSGVYIPAGSETWGSTITLPTNRNINLIGAGDTTLIDISTGGGFQITVSNPIYMRHRISSMKFTGTPTGSIVAFQPSSPSDYSYGWRLDHLTVDVSTAINVVDVRTLTYGLIDHVNFKAHQKSIRVVASNSANDVTPTYYGSYEKSNWYTLGTVYNVVIEDSILTNASTVAPAGNVICEIDLGGGSLIIRNSTINGGMIYTKYTRSTSGGGTNGYYGVTKIEIYNCELNGNYNENGEVGLPFRIQSGTAVFYNNWVHDFSDNYIELSERRGAGLEAYAPLYDCQGSRDWDGNIEASGWPCMGQIGRGQRTGEGTEAWAPLYEWNNGSDATCIDGGSCTDTIDFYVVASSSDYIYIYPSTHTNGQWEARDDTVNPGYAALQEPHPLQGVTTRYNISGGSFNGVLQ